jgi:hypothetical protein
MSSAKESEMKGVVSRENVVDAGTAIFGASLDVRA